MEQSVGKTKLAYPSPEVLPIDRLGAEESLDIAKVKFSLGLTPLQGRFEENSINWVAQAHAQVVTTNLTGVFPRQVGQFEVILSPTHLYHRTRDDFDFMITERIEEEAALLIDTFAGGEESLDLGDVVIGYQHIDITRDTFTSRDVDIGAGVDAVLDVMLVERFDHFPETRSSLEERSVMLDRWVHDSGGTDGTDFTSLLVLSPPYFDKRYSKMS